jgi:hypothetical protein
MTIGKRSACIQHSKAAAQQRVGELCVTGSGASLSSGTDMILLLILLGKFGFWRAHKVALPKAVV